MKIAVMGAGAVGSYYGAMLARDGHDVTLIGRAPHVAAIVRDGLLFESASFNGRIAMHATTEPSGVSGAEIVLFCVKSADTEIAGREMAPHLSSSAAILCLQNGIDNAERLQAAIDRQAIPTVVYVATEIAAPGHLKHNGRGELIIGPSPSSETVAQAFTQAAIPTTVSNRVIEAMWTKLITNCAYNALSAIGDMPYGPMLKVDGVRDLMTAVIDECVVVAHAAGIATPTGLHDAVLALADSMPDQFSSTAQDLKRGKPTEIDFLNGQIVAKGRDYGIPTPANLALQVAVTLREARHRASD